MINNKQYLFILVSLLLFEAFHCPASLTAVGRPLWAYPICKKFFCSLKIKCLALRRSALILFKKILSIFVLFGLFIYLLKYGDVERTPGPPLTYENFLSKNKKLKDPLCFLQLNCRSLVNKREQLKKILKECSNNTVFAFTETWLTNEDDINLWCLDKNYYSCFRCDRISEKSKGGGVMLLIPKIFNLKNRNDFSKMSKDFKTLRVEITLP